MTTSMSFVVGVIAVLMLSHAAYSTIQYRALLKITEDEFSGPPFEVLVELTLVLILSLFAGLTVPGNFRSILPDSDENSCWYAGLYPYLRI
ncbi:membrane magnesium transporter isoform X2 [Cynara cardunculus var. scolymus]|uniref:membrane magnesium transporter isoform X2 n=1 Tax=Cynara cardunculus var. scolymus TaxID=59895 RepID=UPI000D62A3ED|nr:membrane magnesium transporter isoform X2 [Cynara cardunculus var. scolymus]